MTDLQTDLTRLGDALERAAADELRSSARSRFRPSRRVLVLAAVLVLVVPAAAISAARVFGSDDVAASMPAGALILAGTHPTCTVVRADVEYHCVLARPPAPEVSDFTGTVYQTVDATHHVNGGCRSLRADGLVWQCYLGEEAVKQQIISESFLGEVQTVPAVG
ncbi:MAG: hypothetical protein QOE36_3662 [Gaiellaceae bacterium]|jgi:hypothetical protein|nr:hypothetical protein [Gaiellaceae bacterium]